MNKKTASRFSRYSKNFFCYIGSLFYDLCILLSLFLVVTSLCLAFRQGEAIRPGEIWYQSLLYLTLFLYYYLSYRYGQQTIGQKAFKIHLDCSAPKMSVAQIAIRTTIAIPSYIVCLLCLKKAQTLMVCLSGTQLKRK